MRKQLLLLLVVAVLLPGCLSMFRGNLGSVEIITDPEDADVSYAGETLIFTPNRILLPRDRTVSLLIKKDGYKDTYLVLEAKTNGWWWVASILLNATHGVFTFGITAVYGITFDAAIGAMNEFETPVLVRLQKRGEEAKEPDDEVLDLIPFEEERGKDPPDDELK